MPGGMPGNISQGRVVKALSKLLSTKSTADLGLLFSDLADPTKPLVDHTSYNGTNANCIAEEHGLVQEYPGTTQVADWNKDKPHLFEHWMGGPAPAGNSLRHGGWWEDQQPLGRVIRVGLRMAIRRINWLDMNASRPPVDCYWVCAGHHFDVTVVENKDYTQIPDANGNYPAGMLTVLFMTPTPPFSRRLLRRLAPVADEDIWVSKHYAVVPGETVKHEPNDKSWVTTQLKRFEIT